MATKILLAVIALGLWLNAAVSLMRPAAAQTDYGNVFRSMDGHLNSIDSRLSGIDSEIGRIQRGSCSNNKLC